MKYLYVLEVHAKLHVVRWVIPVTFVLLHQWMLATAKQAMPGTDAVDAYDNAPHVAEEKDADIYEN